MMESEMKFGEFCRVSIDISHFILNEIKTKTAKIKIQYKT
jgi:hypothetical protein